jgi:hypothetical protein
VTTLEAALAQLVDAELIYQRGVPPDATYQFKHALVQDASYASWCEAGASSDGAENGIALMRQGLAIMEAKNSVIQSAYFMS